jgi:hypothetical protein
MPKYQLHDDGTVIRHEADGSRTFLPTDDDNYQAWLLAGNQPLAADTEVKSPQEQRMLEIEQLKKDQTDLVFELMVRGVL